MSIHPSLRSSEKTKKAKSVLKRSERIRIMMERSQWKEESGVYGLPKIKTIKIKIKKEKAAEKTEAAAATAAGAPPAPSPKEASLKPSGKAQEKK